MKYFKLFVIVLLLKTGSINAQSGDLLFSEGFIHEIRLTFSENEYWDSLTTRHEDFNTFSGDDIPYLAANVMIDGENLASPIGVRLKGKSSYFYVPNDKKPFKLDFNEYDEEQEFDGLKKINLHNGFGDPSMLRDKLAYGMLRQVGVSAPRVAYCHLYLNDEYWGLYEMVEQIDKTFLKNNFASDKGNLWKNQRWSELKWYGDDPNTYRDTFSLKTNETEDDWSAFIHFLDVVNNTSDADFADSINAVFDVDEYLHVLAVDVMTNNWDSYLDNERNFYLYHEPKSGNFHWIPWDYNLSMGGAITVNSEPLPPYDPFCVMQSDFTFSKNNNTVTFTEFSEPAAETWFWEFGDGMVSNTQNPNHSFDTSLEKTRVCLTTTRTENGNICEQKRCQTIDLTFNAGDCATIQDGTCPYDAADPIFQQTIVEDPFCCSDTWDVFCEIKYQEIQSNPPAEFNYDVDYDIDFPLVLDDPDKVLIQRILNVPEFKERYLDICCVMLDKVFNLPDLSEKINFHSSLIRDAVHSDPNYLYNHDAFEYDVGNGTGGGNTSIPALRYFLDARVGQLITDLVETAHNCAPAFTDVQWHDLVINEFVASNQEDGGTADADGEYDDWIEIYNNTFTTIDLSSFYLSDDILFSKKWKFPNGTSIAPGEYLIVWADKDLQQQSTGLHTNFGLSKSGERIILTHEDETIIDLVEFEEQTTNIAVARIPNGTGNLVLQAPTFQQNNETATATQEIANLPFKVFPNPTNNFLTIKTPQDFSLQNWKLTLVNVVGAKILEQIFSENTNSARVDVRHLDSGVYFLEMKNESNFFTQRVIVY